MDSLETSYLRKDWFVEVDDVRRIGKLVGGGGAKVDVEFFHSVSRREVEIVNSSAINRTFLSRETRVYFKAGDDNRWRMGRIRDYFREDNGSITYEVKCPNGDVRDVAEQNLYARCFAVLGDPAEVLAIGAGETQRWHDARWGAVEELVSLRSAANGLTGLLSGSVELVPHQADAVRRVVCDPLQRYLLADEVGLGKTIEAGAVIRQVLLDQPGRRTLVAVTEPLLKQWERELHQKFGLTPGPELTIVSHEDLAIHKGPVDLLVVDEAHRITPTSSSYAALTRLSGNSLRVLLLSATPMIGNEEAFLSLLKWLDPDRWQTETLDRFRRHVEQSQEYGRLLLGLRPDASAFLLRQRAIGAKQTFADDGTVQVLADGLLNNLDDADLRRRHCDYLREHIADTYRIHHRIVRSRRSDLEGWEFQPRGPSIVREEADDDAAFETVTDLLENWRSKALVTLEANPGLEDALANRFVVLVETAGKGVAALSELPAFDQLFAGESKLIEDLRSFSTPEAAEARAELVALIATRQLKFTRQTIEAPKLVIFATDLASGDAIAAALRRQLGVDAVISLTDDPNNDAFSRFEQSTRVVAAVLDRRGEEGLNLHFADVVVHSDLPLSISRIEQRIGRLDRFGRTKGRIKHVVVIPDGDEQSPWSVWLELLKSGIEIFDRPVSDLQLVIERVEKSVRQHLLRNGVTGIDEYISSLKDLMASERQRLDEQYALDQLAMSREPAKALVATMEKAEEDESALADRIENLLGKLLNFQMSRGKDQLKLVWANNTLLPERPWRPIFDAALKRPLTWKRRVALARPDVSLLRPGAPLVDALEQLLEWDDRGSAFATWRFERGRGGVGNEGLYFRLCWVVSPGSFGNGDVLKMEDVAGLRRRAESFLTPWTLVQYVSADLLEVRDTDVLTSLKRPFQPLENDDHRDFNLGSRPGWLDTVISSSEFSDLCMRIRDFGRKSLDDSEEFSSRCRAGLLDVHKDNERRHRRLETRAARGDRLADRERELDQAVLRAVQAPIVRLDSLGAFVLAGHMPRGGRF